MFSAIRNVVVGIRVRICEGFVLRECNVMGMRFLDDIRCCRFREPSVRFNTGLVLRLDRISRNCGRVSCASAK